MGKQHVGKGHSTHSDCLSTSCMAYAVLVYEDCPQPDEVECVCWDYDVWFLAHMRRTEGPFPTEQAAQSALEAARTAEGSTSGLNFEVASIIRSRKGRTRWDILV
jgi:hypothetical protein